MATKKPDPTQDTAASAEAAAVAWLEITTRRDGFRRAGRAWQGSTRVRRDEFSAQQLEQLRNEPLLSVREFTATEAALDADADTSAAAATA